ncbi:hypothetical protein CW687_11770 [Macrococcoides caseolyticum]|nr:hypothetical protein CW687_11770 [Macrococcus caseolyticus]
MLPIDKVQTKAKGKCHPYRMAAQGQEQGKVTVGLDEQRENIQYTTRPQATRETEPTCVFS